MSSRNRTLSRDDVTGVVHQLRKFADALEFSADDSRLRLSYDLDYEQDLIDTTDANKVIGEYWYAKLSIQATLPTRKGIEEWRKG